MKDLNKLIPLKIYTIDNVIINVDKTKFKTNNVVVLNSDIMNSIKIINDRLFRVENVLSYFSELNIQNPFNKKNIRMNKESFINIKENTHIINTPLNIGMLKEKNMYYNIYNEMQFIDNEEIRIKTIKVRAEHYLKLLNSKFKYLESLGYTIQYFVMDLTKENFDDQNSLLNTLHWLFKFGYEDKENVLKKLKSPVRMVFRNFQNKDTFYFDYNFDGKKIELKHLTQFDRTIKIEKSIIENEKIENTSGEVYYIYDKKTLNTITDLSAQIHYSTEKELIETAFINEQTINSKNITDKFQILRSNGYHFYIVTGNNIQEIDCSGKFMLTNEEIKNYLKDALFNKYIGEINKNGDVVKSENEIYQDLMQEIDNIVTNIKEDNITDIIKISQQKIKDSSVIKNTLKKIDEFKVLRQKALANDTLYKQIKQKNTENITTIINTKSNVNLSKKVDIDVPFSELTESIADNIDTYYSENTMSEDIINIFNSFSDENSEPPIILTDVVKTDTSDIFYLKDTYEATFNIPGRKPQKIKLDIPKFTADGYLFTHGSKKTVTKQIIAKPIIYIRSSGIDSVQFTTNYNKVFIEKTSGNFDRNITRLIKFLNASYQNKTKVGRLLKTGNSIIKNFKYRNTIEYNEVSKYFISMKFNNFELLFDRDKMNEILLDHGMSPDKYVGYMQNMIPIGYTDKGLYLFSQKGKIYYTEKTDINSLIDENELVNDRFYLFILNSIKDTIGEDVTAQFNSTSVGKKFVFTKIKILGRYIPLISVLGWIDGLDIILDKYETRHVLVKNGQGSPEDKTLDSFIEFSDYKLYYDGTYQNNILYQGLLEMNTKDFTFADFSKKGLGYQDYFININSSNLGRGINNFYGLFIDPITKEILKDLGQPDTFIEALLYCNNLLESTITTRKNDMSNYRVRGGEVISSMLYKCMSDIIRQYRDSYKTGSMEKTISLPQDKLLKDCLESPLVEEMVLMNPIKEARNRTKTTYKGTNGTNIKHAKGSEEIREYDKSMVGVLTVSATDDSNVGVTRFLSINPKINSRRGYIDTNLSVSDLNATNILNISDLNSAYTNLHADSARVSMQAG